MAAIATGKSGRAEEGDDGGGDGGGDDGGGAMRGGDQGEYQLNNDDPGGGREDPNPGGLGHEREASAHEERMLGAEETVSVGGTEAGGEGPAKPQVRRQFGEGPPTAHAGAHKPSSQTNALAALLAGQSEAASGEPPNAESDASSRHAETVAQESGKSSTARGGDPERSLEVAPVGSGRGARGWIGLLTAAGLLIHGVIRGPFDALELTAWTSLGALVLGLGWTAAHYAQPIDRVALLI
jgi:hypothetical protein